MEGGANVVSEALVAGVPMIASEIPCNAGLLGKDYPGYYPAGDEHARAPACWQEPRPTASSTRCWKNTAGPASNS
jgi:hypothetical protein